MVIPPVNVILKALVLVLRALEAPPLRVLSDAVNRGLNREAAIGLVRACLIGDAQGCR
jgi:hypothetical protein